MVTSSVKVISRNRKVARLRDESKWKKLIIMGKHNALSYPSILRLERVKRGLSQEALAEAIGVSLPTYSGIECRSRPAKAWVATAIVSALDLSPNLVFEETQKGKFLAIKTK